MGRNEQDTLRVLSEGGYEKSKALLYAVGLIGRPNDILTPNIIVPSPELIPYITAIGKAIAVVSDKIKSNIKLENPFQIMDEKVINFFGSFPYRNAIRPLIDVFSIEYKSERTLQEVQMGEPYDLVKTIGHVRGWDEEYVRSVTFKRVLQKYSVIRESYYPIAEGAYKSLKDIGNIHNGIYLDNSSLKLEEELRTKYQPRRQQSVIEEIRILSWETIGDPPNYEDHERWQNVYD